MACRLCCHPGGACPVTYSHFNDMSDHLHTLRRGSKELAESGPEGPPKKKRRIPTLARALPWLLLAAFAVFAWLLFGDRFERARPVDLVKVVTTRASGESAGEGTSSDESLSFEGRTLFQASGWLESDPLPIRVTTLYSGVVDEVRVLQGEKVEQGQILATMVDEDARLDLESARANLARARAGLDQGIAAVAAASARLETIDKEIAAAQSRRAELSDQYERRRNAGDDVFRESEITQAKLRLATQDRRIEALQSGRDELRAELSSARASKQVAEAGLEHAGVDVDRRQLALDRTQVRSPVDGRVQELYAAPGIKRMLSMDGMETATVAKIFQPDSLQARIDVPLEEAAQLGIGQAVRLRSSILPNQIFKGVVTRIDGQADLQRNTLQAKVRLLDPDEQLRPEMLCRAEFLAVEQDGASGSAATPGGRAAIFAPGSALSGDGRERRVWALDAGGKRLERRSVVVEPESRDGYLRVIEGLRPGEFVVSDPPNDLEAGERVKPEK